MAALAKLSERAASSGLSSTTLARLTAAIVPLVLDRERVEAYVVRHRALRALTDMKNLLALEAVRTCHAELSARLAADPGSPTALQDAALSKLAATALAKSGVTVPALVEAPASVPASAPATAPAPLPASAPVIAPGTAPIAAPGAAPGAAPAVPGLSVHVSAPVAEP